NRLLPKPAQLPGRRQRPARFRAGSSTRRSCSAPMSLRLWIDLMNAHTIEPYQPQTRLAALSRREMLARLGNGCGLVGLAAVLADELSSDRRAARAAEIASAPSAAAPLSPKPPHFKPKAK